MKIRFIIYITLILGGGWWIAFFASGRLAAWLYERQQRANDPTVTRIIPEGMWAKKLKTSWTNTTVVLYRASGEVVQLDAKKAVYTVWSIKDPARKGKEFDIPVAAFIDPQTRNVWIGEVDADEVETNEYVNDDHAASTNFVTYTNLFIENDSEILRGNNVLVDGTFDCNESPIKSAQPDEGLDSVIDRFDKSTNVSWPFSSAGWTTTFANDFRQDFFASSGNFGDQTTPIQHIEAAHGKWRLDFDSQKYKTTGSVWLNMKTLKVSKAIEHK